jgi:mRNA interferase MazF
MKTRSGIKFEQGEIILISFPFSDLSTTKRRPVLVLSKKHHNDESEDFVCCGITSNLQNKRFSIILNSDDLQQGKIPRTSRIKFNKIFTLEKKMAAKRLGQINEKMLKKVQDALVDLLI